MLPIPKCERKNQSFCQWMNLFSFPCTVTGMNVFLLFASNGETRSTNSCLASNSWLSDVQKSVPPESQESLLPPQFQVLGSSHLWIGLLSPSRSWAAPEMFAFGRFLVTAALWHGARSAPHTEPDCDEPVSATSSALLQRGNSDFSLGARAFLPSLWQKNYEKLTSSVRCCELLVRPGVSYRRTDFYGFPSWVDIQE